MKSTNDFYISSEYGEEYNLCSDQIVYEELFQNYWKVETNAFDKLDELISNKSVYFRHTLALLAYNVERFFMLKPTIHDSFDFWKSSNIYDIKVAT